jgi:dTDP-4-dehydrorhamnose 3,5-epimerase
MSNIKIIDTEISDVKLIEPKLFDDDRGHFFESFNKKSFNQAIGLNVEFVQDNQSFSKLGVLRGLHKQSKPYEQAKLVRVVFGEIYDVAVDVRKESTTFGKWVGEYLSSENYKQLWIPEGFAHGFLTMSEYAEVLYKTNNFYNKESEVSINPFDKELNIKWPEPNQKVIMSAKDLHSINFKELYD